MIVTFNSEGVRYSLVVAPQALRRDEKVEADPNLWASKQQKKELTNVLALSDGHQQVRRERQRHYRKVYGVGAT